MIDVNYLLLLIGALLFAGVAISVISFYEDFYWGDREFRDLLREGSEKRKKRI